MDIEVALISFAHDIAIRIDSVQSVQRWPVNLWGELVEILKGGNYC